MHLKSGLIRGMAFVESVRWLLLVYLQSNWAQIYSAVTWPWVVQNNYFLDFSVEYIFQPIYTDYANFDIKNFFKTFFMYSETVYPKQTKLDLKGLWMILIQTSHISKMVSITDNRKMSSNINCSCMTISCSNCFSVNLCVCKWGLIR